MTEKILLIKAKGGLGNRILSAVNGLIFADLTQRRAVIDWRDGSYAPLGENAYPLLFKSESSREVEEFDNFDEVVSPKIWQGNLSLTPQDMIEKFMPRDHSNPMAYRRLCTNLDRLDTPNEIAVFWSYLPKFSRIQKHLNQDSRFRNRNLNDIISHYLNLYFMPNAYILREVEGALESIGSPNIGLHIRYTDRKISLKKVKKALRNRLLVTPNAKIFLATDNAAVQSEIRSEFENVFTIDKYLPNDGSRLHWPTSDIKKIREAENALIDMWVLSRCEYLIYSRHSTFSVTSSYLGGIPENRLYDVDMFSPNVVFKRFIQKYT